MILLNPKQHRRFYPDPRSAEVMRATNPPLTVFSLEGRRRRRSRRERLGRSRDNPGTLTEHLSISAARSLLARRPRLARRGQSLVVWAIWEGRECARGVEVWLMGETSLPSSPEL